MGGQISMFNGLPVQRVVCEGTGCGARVYASREAVQPPHIDWKALNPRPFYVPVQVQSLVHRAGGEGR